MKQAKAKFLFSMMGFVSIAAATAGCNGEPNCDADAKGISNLTVCAKVSGIPADIGTSDATLTIKGSTPDFGFVELKGRGKVEGGKVCVSIDKIDSARTCCPDANVAFRDFFGANPLSYWDSTYAFNETSGKCQAQVTWCSDYNAEEGFCWNPGKASSYSHTTLATAPVACPLADAKINKENLLDGSVSAESVILEMGGHAIGGVRDKSVATSINATTGSLGLSFDFNNPNPVDVGDLAAKTAQNLAGRLAALTANGSNKKACDARGQISGKARKALPRGSSGEQAAPVQNSAGQAI